MGAMLKMLDRHHIPKTSTSSMILLPVAFPCEAASGLFFYGNNVLDSILAWAQHPFSTGGKSKKLLKDGRQFVVGKLARVAAHAGPARTVDNRGNLLACDTHL